jgi:two-component system chemotaxis sensor kinase CheA
VSDRYLDGFLRESEEAITQLNNSLLDLEDDPGDRDAMERIFRTAHTLKGNFGAMGFQDAADLAHAIEDLLDEMREGNRSVTADRMDPIFAGVDRIEAIVAEIEETGESNVATDEPVADLRAVLESTDGGAAGADDADEVGTQDAGEAPADLVASLEVDADAIEERAANVRVSVGETDMPGVDAMLTLESIEEAFDVVATRPDRAAIEDGEFDEHFDVVLDAGDLGRVDAELDAIGTIDAAEVTDMSGAIASAGASSGGDEDAVEEIKSVRVDVDQLDVLHGLVEQLVTSRIKLRRSVEQGDLESAEETLGELDKITDNLQNTVMDMRLIPLQKVVGKLPRLVRDLARDLDKEVVFEIEGDDIELDRTILTEMGDPLMHILRNAVDHGIEPPEEREAAGKPRQGQIRLEATRERDHVDIAVHDDGAGLDPDRIRAKAVEEGVRSASEVEAMEDSAVYDLTFHPGFSTAEEVTDTSGRGVGMDVVHDTVTQLDGSVSVDSTPGEGTAVNLRLPVTMAIVKVLFVEVGDEEYGIPIKNVDEITGSAGTQPVNGREVIKHDDEIYPVVDLGETFDVPGDRATNGDGMLVRIRESERQVALRCDAVNAQEEVVVRPLEGILSGTPGLSGTAVLGEGNVVHILDVVTL